MYLCIMISAGQYLEPYLLIRSSKEIQAIDLLTLETSVVIRGLTGEAMDIDTVDKKIYFGQGNNISRANFDGSRIEIVVRNVKPVTVRVDWKGRRIFWTNENNNEISMATLNGQERRVLRDTEGYPSDLAVDSIKG